MKLNCRKKNTEPIFSERKRTDSQKLRVRASITPLASPPLIGG